MVSLNMITRRASSFRRGLNGSNSSNTQQNNGESNTGNNNQTEEGSSSASLAENVGDSTNNAAVYARLRGQRLSRRGRSSGSASPVLSGLNSSNSLSCMTRDDHCCCGGDESKDSTSSNHQSSKIVVDSDGDVSMVDVRVEEDLESRRAGSIASLNEVIEQRRLHSDNKSASGMSQNDLRSTIRLINTDPNLTPQEKTKKIQEVMSFSWRKSQPVRTNSLRRLKSQGAMRPRSVGAGRSSGNISGRTGNNSSSEEDGNGTQQRRRSGRASSVVLSRRSNSIASLNGEVNLNGIDYVSVADDETEGDEDLSDDELEDDASGDTQEEEEEEAIRTWHNEALGQLGCEHYQRKCHISAPCCGEFFCCRFCHNENCDHEIDRTTIDTVRCMDCAHVQPISEECEKCSLKFARYYCKECRFFDDKEGKSIYHCDKCKICRIGEGIGIDYFHCDRCNACMSMTLKEHKCVERSLESDCPVCSEYLFTSTIPVMFLPCGHCIHVACYESYTQTNFTCPLCCKSLGDMSNYFSRIDEMLAAETMPEEYRGLRSLIFCSDCETRSIAPFHFVYHKCSGPGGCGSYNTKVLEELPRETDKSPASSSSSSSSRDSPSFASRQVAEEQQQGAVEGSQPSPAYTYSTTWDRPSRHSRQRAEFYYSARNSGHDN